ncbi:MAG: hypothetical protein V2I35_13720 [Desulfocapsaceae bacterium]|nr:hypothetical protein [Desulfocapsaceae bacterium]
MLEREEIARREIGVTVISRRCSQFLSIFFLLSVFMVPVIQLAIDKGPGFELSLAASGSNAEGSWTGRLVHGNREILRTIDLLERDLEDRSFLRTLFLPPLQFFFTKYLGQGNEQVVSGRNGQLFFRPAVDYLVGPPFLHKDRLQQRLQGHEIWEEPVFPDPIQSIRTFAGQLALRDIDLVVVPVPVKAAVRPTPLLLENVDGPLVNRSWNSFVEQLENSGAQVFDIRELLHDFETASGSAYLATDTHWSPAAVKLVAGRLAEFLEERYENLGGNDAYRFHRLEVSGIGDLHRMLRLPEKWPLFSGETVEIEQVLTATGAFWQPDRNSPVLLLGDSYTNIYSSPGLAMGTGSGLAEHLSASLQRPVDLLARNDDGAFSSREMLATELRRGRDRLAGKRVVVWEFSERELAFGNWKNTDITLGKPQNSDFFLVPPGESMNIQATIADISSSPRPGTIPYRDNIVTVHLVDLKSEKIAENINQALVYGFGMRDNLMTPLATLRPGDRVSMTLFSWEEKETEYGSYRRTSLDDDMIELELPNWGVINED